MFPFEIDEDDEELQVTEKEYRPYREYEIDFWTGQLTGRIVEGKDAVRAWLYLTLNIERYVYEQYSWDYGNELTSLIGQKADRDYIEMRAMRIVEECILQNPHIYGIEDFNVTITDEKVEVYIAVSTEFGEVEMNVQ